MIHKLILLYKISNGFAPQYLCDLLESFYPRSHQNNLRNNNKFILPQIKTTSYMESFLPSTTKLWNNLSDFIKISPTLSSFKKHLKEFFSKTPNDLYHFGARRCNIIHCQLSELL